MFGKFVSTFGKNVFIMAMVNYVLYNNMITFMEMFTIFRKYFLYHDLFLKNIFAKD